MYRPEEIDAVIARSIAALDFKNEPQNLYAPLEYMISIGGKRIRPRLCLTTF
ncbi:MAG: polyprenyl synthetase family protein, partial [Bacteroidales bacterium]|nr:polyprenyl synthetase family protein [Bacteroidales bacterium]